MKHAAKYACLAGFALFSTSCMTTYDARGRPVQSVDPGAAVIGAAAAATIGYALAKDNKKRHHYRKSSRRHHYPRYDRGRRHRRSNHCY